MSKTAIKGKQRNHVPWKLASRAGRAREDIPLDGQEGRGLWDPVPAFFFREGDEYIKGENNTLICLGRDRAPEFGEEDFPVFVR